MQKCFTVIICKNLTGLSWGLLLLVYPILLSTLASHPCTAGALLWILAISVIIQTVVRVISARVTKKCALKWYLSMQRYTAIWLI